MQIQCLTRKKNIIYQVQVGETLKDIMTKFRTTSDEIEISSKNKKIEAGVWLLIRNAYQTIHIVKPTETLSTIANKYNISIKEISSKNKLINNKLFIGQKLIIK